MATATSAMENLQATANTGWSHNIFSRKEKLKSLHDSLRVKVSELKDAIRRDTGVSDAEASTEIALSLRSIKDHYASLDPEKELENEYRIANGKDNESRRDPWGVVYIEPQLRHTPLFSIIAPLGTALAAGNCVLLKLENITKALPTLLRNILPKALESDTFTIVSSSPAPEDLKTCLQVLQGAQVDSPTQNQLASSRGKVIAIVDRTADLTAAAENLVNARFSFGGTSGYAPDLVLVNEFVKQQFLELVLRHAIRFMTSDGLNGRPTSPRTRSKETPRIENSLEALQANKNWSVKVVTKGDRGAVVEFTNKSAKHTALPSKVAEPILCISAITSLDHAIDLISRDSDLSLAAAYHFASPAYAKYLAQFLKADVSFVNRIPISLLLGPTAPLYHQFDLEYRYTKEHFEQATPSFITKPNSQTKLHAVLAPQGSKKVTHDFLVDASTEIKEKKRAEWIAHGFFEQGIFIGLGIYGVPFLTCIGASIFFGVRFGLRKWATL